VQKAKYNKITLVICCMRSIHFGVVYDFASPAGEVPVMSDIALASYKRIQLNKFIVWHTLDHALHPVINKAARYLHTSRLLVYPTLPFRTESKLIIANRVST
jgi:hypothetical protein